MKSRISNYADILVEKFLAKINQKNSWGKNEVRLAFMEAMQETANQLLDEAENGPAS